MARRGLVALALAAALGLAGCGSGADTGAVSGVHTEDDGFAGTALPSGYVVPDVPLTATDGSAYSLAKADAPLKVVFFGYSKCPDICQVVMSTIASAVARLDPAQQRRVQVVFVTTDPARDTRQALRGYLDRFDPQFAGLTGPLSRIDALGRPLGVYIRKGHRLPSGGYEVDHTAGVTAVRDGRAPLVWTHGTSPTDMAADIHRLLEES